ncbi:putative metal-dependent hydrolase [Sphingobium sp. SYK-6]|uniref:endonuclease/exonuclease/phosphatase family protein n=1 Tax=Sphingobium sp. (strain NBRC 103272 / SYK-6) TaxID=627192 RepID=UPI0002277226|nr:endonuclease/exonuclease/phosphatase family protein [Sphingobium sp. SYK-6]BAK66444.1 putative metal-dependent hydrolase [Sphingobium sp. SYK-6]
MIKVASYNIRKAIGTDRRRLPERIIDVLNELDADVIALQEADRRFGPRHAVLPDRLLAMHSDYRAVELPTRTESMGWHGNALLVRRDAQEGAAGDVMHLPCLEPRGAVLASLDLKGMKTRVVGMHLDLSGLWRRRQAAAVVHHVDQLEDGDPSGATILMGDTNEWTVNRGCLADFARQYEIAPCGRSFHARRQVAALDRIMWRGNIALEDCGVHSTALARRASDHLPIWATFSTKG